MANTININVGTAASIVLPANPNTIKSTIRQGKNLVIELTNGQVLVLEGYFENEPKLFTNSTGGKEVVQLNIDADGKLVGSKTLSYTEAEALLGSENMESLAKQTSDILLFTPGETTTILSTPVLIGAATVLAVGGVVAAASGGGKGGNGGGSAAPSSQTITINNPDGSVTTKTTQPNGNYTAETTKDGKVISKETFTHNKDGSTTKVVEKDTTGNGKFDTQTTTTTHTDGSSTTEVKKDTDGDGTYEKTVSKETVTPNKDGSKTTVTETDTTGNGKPDTQTTKTEKPDGSSTSETKKEADGDKANGYEKPVSKETVTPNKDGSKTTVTETDTTGNGKPDTQTTKTENPDGSSTTEVKKDTNGDGKYDTPVSKEKETTNPDGTKVTKTETDTTGNGKYDTETTKTENPDGSKTTEVKKDTNGDGSYDTPVSKETTTPKADGTVETKTETDTTGNGKYDTETTKTEHPNGTTTTEVKKDTNGDGTYDTPVSKETTTPKADGTVVTKTETDTTGNGKYDTETTKTQNPDGSSTTEVKKDTDGNSGNGYEKPVSKETVTPKADGTVETKTQVDTDGDGKYDTETTKVEHPNGTVTTEVKKDKDGDGKYDAPVSKETTTPNADGSKTTVTETDTTGNGKYDTETTKTETPDGSSTTEVKKDTNGDGKYDAPVSKETTTPKADGTVVTKTEADTTGDGKYDTETTKTQNPNGTTTTEVKKDADGDKANGYEKPVSKETVTPKADGTVVTKTEADTTGDGEYDTETIKTQHPNGTTTTEVKKDTDNNGSYDAPVSKETVTPKANGSVETKTETDASGNGKYDTETVKTTNPDGSSTTVVKQSTQENGTYDKKVSEETVTHTPEGKQTVTKADTTGDGKYDTQTTTLVKADGTTVTEVVKDKNGDEAFDDKDVVLSKVTVTPTYEGDKLVKEVRITEEPAKGTRTVETSTFDDQGRVVKKESDRDGNDKTGTNGAETVEYYEYNPDGSVTKFANTDGKATGGNSADGSKQGIDQITKTIYDEQGRVKEELVDNDRDSLANPADRTKYDVRKEFTYDDKGRKTSESTDKTNDGTIDEKVTYEYDDANNIKYTKTDLNPSDGQNKAEVIVKEQLDDKGRVVVRETDETGNGGYDKKEVFTYEGDSTKPTSIETSKKVPGATDYVVTQTDTMTYDDFGRETSKVTTKPGTGNTVEVTKDYSQPNKVVETVKHNGAIWTETAHTLDSHGRTGYNLRDYGGDHKLGRLDGQPEQFTKKNYDALGNETQSKNFRNTPDIYAGNPNQEQVGGYVVDTVYDRFGNVIKESIDTNGDGKATRIVTKTYDENNREVIREIDINGDGKTNVRSAITYDQFGNQDKIYINADANDATGNTLGAKGEYKGTDIVIDRDYDEYGRLVRESYNYMREAGDTTEDKITHITYSYDANTKTTTKVEYINLDGSSATGTTKNAHQGIDRVVTTVTDEKGRTIQKTEQNDNHTPNKSTYYVAFDDYGNVTKELVDENTSVATGQTVEGKTGIDLVIERTFNPKGEETSRITRNENTNKVEEAKYTVFKEAGQGTDLLHTIYYLENKDGDDTTGQTITIDGKEYRGIDYSYERVMDSKSRTIKKVTIDGNAKSVEYIHKDFFGNEIEGVVKSNKNTVINPLLIDKDGNPNTGKTLTIDGKTYQGIEELRVTEYKDVDVNAQSTREYKITTITYNAAGEKQSMLTQTYADAMEQLTVEKVTKEYDAAGEVTRTHGNETDHKFSSLDGKNTYIFIDSNNAHKANYSRNGSDYQNVYKVTEETQDSIYNLGIHSNLNDHISRHSIKNVKEVVYEAKNGTMQTEPTYTVYREFDALGRVTRELFDKRAGGETITKQGTYRQNLAGEQYTGIDEIVTYDYDAYEQIAKCVDTNADLINDKVTYTQRVAADHGGYTLKVYENTDLNLTDPSADTGKAVAGIDAAVYGKFNKLTVSTVDKQNLTLLKDEYVNNLEDITVKTFYGYAIDSKNSQLFRLADLSQSKIDGKLDHFWIDTTNGLNIDFSQPLKDIAPIHAKAELAEYTEKAFRHINLGSASSDVITLDKASISATLGIYANSTPDAVNKDKVIIQGLQQSDYKGIEQGAGFTGKRKFVFDDNGVTKHVYIDQNVLVESDTGPISFT